MSRDGGEWRDAEVRCRQLSCRSPLPVEVLISLIPSIRRRIPLLLGTLLALYAAPAIVLWLGQDYLLFPAPGLTVEALDEQAEKHGATPIWLRADDGISLYGWHIGQGGSKLVLYFHGNGSSPFEAAGIAALVAPLGYDVLSPSYRGYSPSEGRPSEAGLIEDARTAWRYATTELGFQPEQIVLHGRSLGGGVATALAAEVEPRALVLECTFASVRDVAQRQYPIYPVRFLLRHPFDSEARAAEVGAPVLIAHGDRDEVVPVTQGRRLAESFAQVTYLEVPGQGHGGPLLRGRGPAQEAWLRLLSD
ncbi:MAG: alpha/beta hydrolase [Deltaproteobacteria bacterium]|nr:MAG: alpha/beta hydrolase [Deltaproteobacteria bacterium]